MQSSELVEGRYYAFRDRRQPGVPFLKVKLIAKVGRGAKVKIRFAQLEDLGVM